MLQEHPERKNNFLTDRDHVTDEIINLFIETIGFIDKKDISEKTDIVKDFQIYHEDISIFMTFLMKKYQIPRSVEVESTTIKGLTDFVIDYLESGKPKDYELKAMQKGFWSRFLNWLKV